MKTIQQIKDEYAEENDCDNWDDFLDKGYSSRDIDEIASRYARECCKASLEKAAHSNFDGDMVFFEEITDEENIVLL